MHSLGRANAAPFFPAGGSSLVGCPSAFRSHTSGLLPPLVRCPPLQAAATYFTAPLTSATGEAFAAVYPYSITEADGSTHWELYSSHGAATNDRRARCRAAPSSPLLPCTV